jgi:hypothetical protein
MLSDHEELPPLLPAAAAPPWSRSVTRAALVEAERREAH